MSLVRLIAPARRVASFMASAVLAAMTGCAISTPMHMAAPAPGDRPDDPMQVSVTHAVIDPARRAIFDRYVVIVAAQLPRQPGLVSYSIRRELLGDQVWTLTAWRSAEDRARFFGSGLHLQAMTECSTAIVNVRSVRLELPRAALPMDWQRALAALGPPPWAANVQGGGSR